jgi:hypothetical protein
MFIILAAAAAEQAPAAASQPVPDSDPIVCKRGKTSDVGTHMRPAKVCMKKSEWDLAEKNTQNELQMLHDRSAFNPGRDPSSAGPH